VATHPALLQESQLRCVVKQLHGSSPATRNQDECERQPKCIAWPTAAHVCLLLCLASPAVQLLDKATSGGPPMQCDESYMPQGHDPMDIGAGPQRSGPSAAAAAAAMSGQGVQAGHMAGPGAGGGGMPVVMPAPGGGPTLSFPGDVVMAQADVKPLPAQLQQHSVGVGPPPGMQQVGLPVAATSTAGHAVSFSGAGGDPGLHMGGPPAPVVASAPILAAPTLPDAGMPVSSLAVGSGMGMPLGTQPVVAPSVVSG
jgi:hypothetical protein